jgi:hypothetical protein
MAARQKEIRTATEPIPGPKPQNDNPRSYLDDYGDDEDCGCSSLFIDPNNLVFVFQPITSGIGFGEQTEFAQTLDITLDIPPCTGTMTLPGSLPGPPFHSKAVASCPGFGFLGRIFWARVHCTLETTYEIFPKEDGCEDCLGATIDLDGSLAGFQQAAGRGFALAQATAYLEIEPFHQPLAGITLGQPVTPPALFGIDWNSPRQGFQIGGAFRKLFHDSAFVPYGVPQNILVRTTVYAQARLLVRSEARIDKLTFTLSGPDPRGGGQRITVGKAKVRIEKPPSPPPPVPGAKHTLRQILAAPRGERTTSVAAANGQILLASMNGRGSLIRRVDPRTGRARITHRLPNQVVARLRAMEAADTVTVYAALYGSTEAETGYPAPHNARLVLLEEGQKRPAAVYRGLHLPSDMTSAPHAGSEDRMLVADLGDGAVLEYSRRGQPRLVVEGIAGPDAIATPPAQSAWRGALYVAETRRQSTKAGLVEDGRVLEFRSGRSNGTSILNHVSAQALMFARGGAFGNDLLIAVCNEIDSRTLLPIPGTGRVLRVNASKAVSVAVKSIDDPHDIAVTPDGRVFILSGQGLYELRTTAKSKQ